MRNTQLGAIELKTFSNIANIGGDSEANRNEASSDDEVRFFKRVLQSCLS